MKILSDKVPTPVRTSHPFLTYDMIKEIPNAMRTTLQVLRESKLGLRSSGSVVFTGSGTGFYSAKMGSQALNFSSLSWIAEHAYELTNYESNKISGGLVIGVSHSGVTKSTMDALLKAKSQGAYVLGLTHFQDRPISKIADKTLIIGNGPDKSRCHTKTYISSATAVLELSLQLAQPLKGELETIRKQFDSELFEKVESAISATEQPAQKAGKEFGSFRRIFFVGAGPNLISAKEAALKIKESSYLAAEAMELEEILHGPWVSFDEKTLVVVIVPSGPSQERAEDLVAAARRIGAKTLVVSDSSNLQGDYTILVPSIHEYLSPFLTIIPLYFFAYFIAVEKGDNPDLLRYLDPKYWAGRSIIFPPGTH
jgi:glutamine---fructose-6-phosphate transaminase (isomerizing)